MKFLRNHAFVSLKKPIHIDLNKNHLNHNFVTRKDKLS